MISDYFDPQMTRFVSEVAVGVLTTLLSYAAMLNSPAQRKENERWLRQGRQDLIEDRDKAQMDAIAISSDVYAPLRVWQRCNDNIELKNY